MIGGGEMMMNIIYLFSDHTGMFSGGITPEYKTAITVSGCGVTEGILSLDTGASLGNHRIEGGAATVKVED